MDHLLEDGWLKEGSQIASRERGRRPTPLEVDDRRRVLLGADVDDQRIELVVTTLTGHVRELSTMPISGAYPAEAFGLLAQQVAAMRRKVTQSGIRACGLGVSVPGPVSELDGVLRYSELTGWQQLPVRALLVEHLEALSEPVMPVVIQRAIGARALHHLVRQATAHRSTDVYVHIGHSIGFAIVVRGSFLRARMAWSDVWDMRRSSIKVRCVTAVDMAAPTRC